MRLFNLVKGLFSKPEEAIPDSAEPVPALPAPGPLAARAHAFQPSPVAAPRAAAAPMRVPLSAVSPARPVAPHVAAPAEPAPAALSTGSGEIQMPLATLISSLPVELQARVRSEMIASAIISLPLERILPQLANGLVRVTFGELRASAPDAFTDNEDRDAVDVILPLGELVSRMAPLLGARRPQKRVEVPDEINSPFGANGAGLKIGKPDAKPAFTSPRGAPSTAHVSPPPSADLRARGNVPAAPAPAAPRFTPPPAGPGGTEIFQRKPAAPAPAPVAMPTFSNGNGNGNGHSHRPPTPAPAPVAPAAPRPAILIPLARVSEAWPDGVRAELAGHHLNEAHAAIPAEEIEAALKRGKVVLTWKVLRAYIKPTPPPTASPHDELPLELPLAVVAPLFLTQKGNGSHQKRVAVDDKIPNLFFGFPQPEATPAPAPAPAPVAPPKSAPVAFAPIAPAPIPFTPPAPVAAPAPAPAPEVVAPPAADTNYFIWDDDKETGRVEGAAPEAPVRTGPSPGTNFLSRKATPNEVVQRASLLEGVYGAMVALPDGLLVAAKLDASLNGDAVAALIPQMYSKLSGCTKELRMGELNNLNFTVGNVPWKIFRVNGLFFAAYGGAGEALPTGELTKLAADLDYRKAK